MMKHNLYILMAAVTCLMMLLAVGLVFLYAPTEATMGVVQKIFYFHVPSAYTMYLSWATCTLASILYLVKRTDNWDMVAKSAAEMALVFAAIVMTTGPIWGRKSWGAYWTWDPRLTSSLLLTLIIISYVLLRAFSSGEVERRFAAALAILGACIIPLIHLSVQKWRGQHPTVITGKGGGLAPSMKIVFAFCMVTFTLFFITLIIRRYKLEKNKRRLDALKEEAATQGISKGAYQ
jgi:heme exporter protein C